MNGVLWAVGGGTVLLAGILSFAMTRRYGWGASLSVPVLALAAVLGMRWQQGAGEGRGLEMLVSSLAFALPVLLGALAGIAVARLWRG
jgi:hypothetical protein